MSIADQERLRSIVRQLSLPIPGSQQHYENVVVGLASSNQSVLLYPDEQQSTFAKLFSSLQPQAAIKARTSTIDVLLADTHPDTPLIHIDENINLPILSSLDATLDTSSVARSAAVVRDEAALLVWSDDARSVAQSFLDLDHRLRHASRQCKCSELPSLPSLRPQTDSMPTSSEDVGYLFAPEHNSVDDSTSGLMLAPMELSELDLPFRPLDTTPSSEDYAMVSDDMMDSGAMPLRLQFDDDCGAALGTSYGITYEMFEAAQVSPWRDPLASSLLLPSGVFSNSSMMAMSAPAHETEPQTVSPSMLHSPYTAGSSTLSPTSTSGALFTPSSSSIDPLPSLWTSPQEPQISPTSTFGAGSIAPATKSLGADSDDHVSVYDNTEPYDSQQARYTSRTPPLPRSPSPQSPVIRRTASHRSDPVSIPRPTKRKRGPSQTPQRQAASLSTRELLPLPKRSANRAVVEKSTTTRLHPLPGCNLRSRRSMTTEKPGPPHPPTGRLRVVVDETHDDESEDIPIDGDGSDEDDGDYEPSPKKVCVSAGAQRGMKKSVTTQGTKRKRGTGGSARRGRGSRTTCGSRRGQFPCTDPECDLVFTRETDMKRHVECVHEKRGIFCPGCNRTYARVDSHKRHLKNGECPKAKPVQRGEPYDEEEHEVESEDDEL